MPIEDFLVDFYSKNTDQEIDQVKIDSIVGYYGGDNVSMINDLYEKYDTGNINDDKFLEIKEYYSLDLPEQGEVVEETTIQETEVEEKEPVIKEQPKHVSIDKIQGKFEEDDVLKNLNDFYSEDIKSGLISFDTSGGMRDEITVTTSAGETVIPLNSDFNTTSGFSSLPGKEYTNYGKDGGSTSDRNSFGQRSYNNLIKTIDSARVKSTPEQKALFQYNDDLGYNAETGTYKDIKAVTQEEVYFPYGTRTGENQEEISSPASTEQVFDMRNMIKTLAVENLINIEKTLNKEQKGFDRSTSTTLPGLAEMDPETNYENIKEKTYQDYVAASKKLNIPYAPFEDGFTAIWGTVKQEAINESKPEERYKKYKEQNTNIKGLDTEQENKRLVNWQKNLTTEELARSKNFENIIETQNKLKTLNERLKSASNSTGNESLVNQKLDLEAKLKAFTETFNTKYKESASRDINGFWINNRSAISDEERERLNNVYKNSTTNAENTLKNSQRSTLTPQEILEDQTNQATLEKLRTLQVGRDQKVKIRLDDAEVITGGIGGKIQTSENKVIRSLLQSGKLSTKDIKNGSLIISYTDLIESGLHTEDFEGFIDQFGVDVKEGRFSFSDGGFMSAKDIKDFKQFERQYYSELMNEQALMDFTYLNKDLAKMQTVYDKEHTGIGVLDHLLGGGGTFIQSAAGAISEMGDGTAQDREQVEGFLGGISNTSTRKDINAADKIIKDYNNSEYVAKNNMQIKLTDEQKENLDQSLGEAIYSGTGEFVPMVIELAAIDLATGGALGPAGVAKAFPRMGKIFQHILNAGIEEVKMQTLFDMPPTGGAAFYTFGAITKNMIKLKGPLARWQGVFDKIMVSGVSGMGASEFSKVSEAVYEDLMNEKTFRQSMNEAYGDLDEVQKRMIVSLGNFSMLGIHHLKKVDFMSTKAKYDLMDAIEIKANNINDKAAAKRGEYTTSDKGERVLNKEFKSIEEKEKYLTESEKSNLNQYSTDFNMLSQYALNESMSNELDPKQVDQATFEKNFNKRYMNPVNRVLKSFDPEYKAPKILFGNSSENPAFRENFRSGKNSTAEITNDGSRMYFDLKYYTPGKALHEIAHLGLQTYYKNNPEAKFRMLEKFDKMFKNVDVDLFLSGEMGEIKLTGKQTKELVKEGYKERNAEERMEEYLAFMVEGLSNPRAYYQNPRIMSGKLAEMRNYFKDVLKEMGANNIEPPQTAYDLIDLLASMGQSARQGTKIQNKFQTFMAALSDENTSFLNSVNIEAFRMAPERTLPENKYREAASKEMASKDLTKEAVVSKSNKEIADANLNIEKEIKDKAKLPVGNRVRDIKDPVLRQEIKDKLEENNRGAVNAAAKKAANNPKILALEKSKRVSENEFKSGFNEQLANLIDTYKPVIEKNGKIKEVPFGAYMQKNLKRRFNQILIQAKKGEFKGQSKRLGQDRAEGEKEFDIKSEEATPEEALIASEEIKAKVTPKSKVTRDFPEIFTEDLKNEIDKGLLEIFEGEIPGVETKEFKSFITEASRGKLTNKVKKALGAGKNYEFSIKKMAEKMKETLDPRFFVRLESQTKPENRTFTKPPRRLTKQAEIDAAMLNDKVYVENTAQGVNIYEFKDFTPKQLSDYILAPTISPTTGAKSGLRGTRKTAFAEGLVDRLTRDATPQNLKRIGKETGEIAEISKKMQVDPSAIMASKDLTKNYNIKNPNKKISEKEVERFIVESLKGDESMKKASIENPELGEFINDTYFNVLEGTQPKEKSSGYISQVKNKVLNKDNLNKISKNLDIPVEKLKPILEKVLNQESFFYTEDKLPQVRQEELLEFQSSIIDFAENAFPKEMINALTSKQIEQLVGYAEKTSGKGGEAKGFVDALNVDGKSFKKGLSNNKSLKENKILSNETKELIKDVDWKNIKVQNVTGQFKTYNEKLRQGKITTKIEKKAAYPKIDAENYRKAQKAISAIKKDYLNSKKNNLESLEKGINFIWNLGRANTSMIAGQRGLIPMDFVYRPEGFQTMDKRNPVWRNAYNDAIAEAKLDPKKLIKKRKTGDITLTLDQYAILRANEFAKMKGEHFNPSAGESASEVLGILKGEFEAPASESILSNVQGLMPKGLLNKVDAAFGSTASYGTKRFALKELKNYLKETVNSKGENLYDIVLEQARKEILNTKGLKELFTNKKSIDNINIATEVFKYAINPTPANKLLLQTAKNNLKANTEVRNQNIEVTKEASMASKDLTQSEMLNELNKRDKAFRLANNRNKTIKKARVFDFDDTIARSKSKVFAERDGKKVEMNAEKFAKDGAKMIEEGWKMDFTDFNVVRDGKKGPLFDLIKTMKEAPGDRDIFILTARAPESQKAIYEFMKAMGVEIPLENITGLGRSEGKAKADWIVDKASEGYNDFYFADDAKSNVKAVRDVLEQLDVKSQVQQAFASKDLSRDFNDIIEQSTGIGAEKIFSDVKAEIRGNKARRQKFFIPPSAEDFTGLLYRTLGKGKKGEAHMKFYQENLLDPYARAMENLSTDRVNLMSDFKALKKELDVPKDLRKTTESGFTNEQAVRTYLWGKSGKEVPGLSKTDMKELSDLVENNPKLEAFADQIMSITKGDGYSTPTKNWATGTITTDLIDVLNTTKRAKYLETWNQNKDIIFSKDNLNKLEAAYGVKYRESMENILKRMKSGRNRIEGGNVLSNKVLDYINNSTGAIMFFNTRSAVLQTISAANFINWGFNNPFRAGKAFANQPQYWKDFTELINSDYLKDRRNGLKLNINESEIANAAKTSGNKAKAALNYILEKGYAPTKFADSFAIASGGATFYRNRINDLIKNEGKTEAEAKEIAMKEFRQVSEMSQQSSDPSKISQQQSSDLGRVVLQFANTPMQYARIQKRAVQDIVNGRGDLKTNISKIAYYGFLQNMLFNALQQGVFALGFGDDEIDEKEEKKLINSANGMLDSSLRGLGMAGVTVQVLKNLGIDIYDRSKRDRPEYGDSYKKLLDFSPAIKSKLGKFQSAGYPFDSKKRRAEVFEKGFSLDNPAYESMAKVITGTTNLPLDRLYSKVNNLSAAMDEETETWQSIAMVLGWPEWQIKGRQNYVEAPKTNEEKIKIKEQRSKVRVKEAKGSTDYETLKKLNKKEQVEMLLKLGYPKGKLSRSNFKEAELIEEIIKRNKK